MFLFHSSDAIGAESQEPRIPFKLAIFFFWGWKRNVRMSKLEALFEALCRPKGRTIGGFQDSNWHRKFKGKKHSKNRVPRMKTFNFRRSKTILVNRETGPRHKFTKTNAPKIEFRVGRHSSFRKSFFFANRETEQRPNFANLSHR